jgi:hypothetical protein
MNHPPYGMYGAHFLAAGHDVGVATDERGSITAHFIRLTVTVLGSIEFFFLDPSECQRHTPEKNTR